MKKTGLLLLIFILFFGGCENSNEPDKNDSFEGVQFIVQVNSNNISKANIKISIKGTDKAGITDANGVVHFTKLDIGDYRAEIYREDLGGFYIMFSITSENNNMVEVQFPDIEIKKPELRIEELENGKYKIAWSESTEEDFEKYVVSYYTEEDTSDVQEINSSYIKENNYYTFSRKNFYDKDMYFRVYVYNDRNCFNYSDVITLKSPISKIYDIVAVDAQIHPTQPIIYILSLDKLYAYNYELETMIAEKDLNFPGEYFVVGDNGKGMELFLPTKEGKVLILNPETFEELRSFDLGISLNSIAIDGRGHFYVSTASDTNAVRSYNYLTGELIDAKGVNPNASLNILPGGMAMVEVSAYSANIMYHYTLNEDGSFGEYVVYPNPYSLDFHPRHFVVSQAGQYMIVGWQGNVFSTSSSMAYVGSIGNNYEYMDYAFDEDNSFVYGAERFNHIVSKNSLPDFSEETSYQFNGLARFIFVRDNKLVAILARQYYSLFSEYDEIAFQVIDLD